MEKHDEYIRKLNEFGYNFKDFNDVMRINKKDKVLIPVLLEWIKEISDTHDQSSISRSLTVKGYTEATAELLELYKSMDNEKQSDKWTVGNAIGVISDRRYIDDYIEIIMDKKHGYSRQMLVQELGAFKDDERVKKALVKLLSDEDVNGHAIYALSKFKDKKLIKKIEPFLEHKMTWKRNEAKKAIKKLEKLPE